MDKQNEQIKAVCKFGPGGDFISFWPICSIPAEPAVVKIAKIEPVLFVDDIPLRFKLHQQTHSHRNRSTTRNTRTRAHHNLDHQATLFDTKLQNAKTA